MSHDYEAFPASGTKIAYLGHTKQNVAFFRFLHGRVYALFRYGSAPPVSIRIYQDLVPTSFVPPAHNQSVSSAHLRDFCPME